MVKYLPILFILICLLSFNSFSQARIILNNGGVVNIANDAFLVINNSNPNAITRNVSGHIISEGKLNRIKWNIGANVGSYTIPFGTGATDYMPVSFATSGASGATGSLTFAMYPVGSWLNTSNLPPGITNFINNYGSDNSAFSIDRFWCIEPANYTTKPTLSNLIFTYKDIEHTVANNVIIESNLIAQRYNNVSNSWDDYMPMTVVNSLANTATVSSLPSSELYTWWTLVDNRFVLPIELAMFNAICDNNVVTINWETVSETNNDYFEIERSTDGADFVVIEKIFSKNSNSTQPLFYTAIDENPQNVKSYYRLRQVDKDGKYSYSSMIIAPCDRIVSTTSVILVLQNPVSNELIIDIKELAGKKSLMIYNTLGQEIISKAIASEDKNVQEVFNISKLAKATYILRIDVNDQFYQIIKFIKN